MKQQQPILGDRGMLLFLVIISAFPPLTTDLYLPAMPQMVEIFDTTQSMINLTLSVYFITYAMGLLFWGPLSEKYGRKPILLIGNGLFILGSLLCSFAPNVESLIAWRVLQAFGGSAVTIVATAIVKDLYEGREREVIMGTIMSLVIIAPMVAPVLGAFLLKVSTWNVLFLVLALFGVIATIFSLCFKETIEQRYTGSVVRSWGRLTVVLKNRNFTSLLGIFSLPPLAMMGFLAAGSYIYIDGFGLTEQQFSFAFAFNALFASMGPRIYLKISRFVPIPNIITSCYIILAICGAIMLSVGHLSPWIFAFIAAPATLVVITTRIPGTNLMLEQQDKDTGSAVAIIQFFGMMCGSMGMLLVSTRPESLIQNLGLMQLVIGTIGTILWILVRRRDYVVQNLPDMSTAVK